ncbi:MAG: hypothetical protein A3B99_01370 [Candidatus Yanofskybacteria bacterium RIFCSPHIGHO2_02_FULL_44_12b]|uniref:UDP-N-acetylglucosamine 2-epimerase domain-containing protein n=1 Tax=Candidatus Wildermuthbacteria bacterium RIFCSPLOWO2_01_FULL_48_16 TaxID=1802461 RepID=A0A1G2RL51_9BACT|nr:MAG: hypothetical protein A3B99_01370 [Candidatus Yanofskybacteria bacterium RIFCSPHIGHO2_02_FULL_44_12b]OHA63834.1 MAG: hypothetical protein A2842_01045 [Candidatus Wildermuthbacteria bacterium RIFCSPHIGHO2_01_FULL_48_25]OHA73583.1 MAG: hypothetical protein A3B24_00120 [Candidatus Wildermuthbacteria bacterium RIFCSPLOWO2_01_FULL_48_16]
MKRKRLIRVLFVSHNPGGFQAIFPVYKRLKGNPKFFVDYIFADEAQSIAEDSQVQFIPVKRVTEKYIEKKCSVMRPDILLFGTSEGLSIDKLAVLVAREQHIVSVALIDYWSNYVMRFSDPGKENLAYLPDWILVMDEYTKQEMINEGFSANQIIVTGNPFFDTLRYSKKEENFPARLVSFFDEPLDTISNEVRIFQDLVNALEELGMNAKVAVKLHPRSSKKNKYNSVIKKSILDIEVDQVTPADDLFRKSDLVLGIASTVLFRAAMEGKRVLSYQPGNKGHDTLITNALGLSLGVYQKSDLKKQLLFLLQKRQRCKNEKIAKAYLAGCATDNVIRFLDALACKKESNVA